ncbi:MAG: pyrimidine 5'-nucleotidase [Hyphomicrobiaceae bacterium]
MADRGRRSFEAVRTWIFDLDNTLYPSECDLFSQVSARMSHFVADFLKVPVDEARAVQKKYYHEHGTTLAGLMTNHGMAPEPYLDYVHDIDYSPVQPSPELARAIAALPGEKLIFTNGSRRHAERVTDRLGITHLFSGTFDIVDAAFIPKPRVDAYMRFLVQHDVRPETAAMFEDLPQNLEAPAELGMTTVLVKTHLVDHPNLIEAQSWSTLPDHIHHETSELAAFLSALTGGGDPE